MFGVLIEPSLLLGINGLSRLLIIFLELLEFIYLGNGVAYLLLGIRPLALTLQQNGVAERNNRHLLDVAKVYVIFNKCSKNLLGTYYFNFLVSY